MKLYKCISQKKVVMKRLFDITIVILSLPFVLLISFIVSLIIKLTSKGPVLFWSERVGIKNHLFSMPKFRTMIVNTPCVATHLLKNSEKYIAPLGGFLRKTSLDELPQIWNILKGDMSFVGPRPALFNQYDLIKLREKENIHLLKPGLTGWAQINGRDNLKITEKVILDKEYLDKKSFLFDIKIIYLTFLKVIKKENVIH